MTGSSTAAKCLQALALAFVGALVTGFVTHVVATKFVGEATGSDFWWASGALVGALGGVLAAKPLRRSARSRRVIAVVGPSLTFGGAILAVWMYFAWERAHRGGALLAGLGEGLLTILGCAVGAIGLALWIANAVASRSRPVDDA